MNTRQPPWAVNRERRPSGAAQARALAGPGSRTPRVRSRTRDLPLSACPGGYLTRRLGTPGLLHGPTCPAVIVRPTRELDLLRVCPLCRPSNRRSVPLPPPSGLGAESGDETHGVGTMWSVRQPCRGGLRLASTLGWPVRGVVQSLRWWLNGDTDAMWLDRCGKDADRLFFHGLAERLLTDRSSD